MLCYIYGELKYVVPGFETLGEYDLQIFIPYTFHNNNHNNIVSFITEIKESCLCCFF